MAEIVEWKGLAGATLALHWEHIQRERIRKRAKVDVSGKPKRHGYHIRILAGP